MEMTPRERFTATVRLEPVDRYYRWEGMGFWPETIARWHGECLPAEINDPAFAYFYHGFDPQSHIDFGSWQHPGFFPLFEEEVLERRGAHLVKRDMTGSIIEVHADGASAIPRYLDFPVKDRAGWLSVKDRLDPASAGRVDQFQPFIQLALDQPWPLFVRITGIFATYRFLFGVEGMMYALCDRPELMHEIAAHWLVMWKSVIRQLCERRRPEIVDLHEDMCGKNGPMISPAMVDEFMMPYYRELVGFFRGELGIPAVSVDTDGDMTMLIPQFAGAGINFLWPFEVQAGMDVTKVRRDWPRIALMGGIDKIALAQGKDAIRKEVERVVPFMLEHCGYIPSTDHNVPPDVSYEDFLFFRDLVRGMG